MFRRINKAFRPNQPGRRGRDGGGGTRAEADYHSACTVRLVRSTSVLVVGERPPEACTLKRSQSTVSVETLYLYRRQEDRVWLQAHSQHCLEYLEALVALRRQYTQSGGDLKAPEAKKAPISTKKKPAPPPPRREEQIPGVKPSTPPVLSEEDTLQFLDAVIATCAAEPPHKPYRDDGHADVDFIVASSSAEHDLHSNWVLKVPRVAAGDADHRAARDCAKQSVPKQTGRTGSTSSRLRLQRNPIHLPKVVASALQTLRFKPKLKKQ
ncbi:uncharacterized protein C13orf42 [Cololabis saira]|uniref:uncharacterized protein C13orf42 n=1 Tax=Cololabis saira TaxID=129043 RepID=UPI002AD38B55|nr:uncharacterized protein C13orf42 [Cololabis saira]